MTPPLNATHDTGLRSWVESANDADTDFPIQNLPFGVFRRDTTSIGVAIGDQILNLGACKKAGLLSVLAVEIQQACMQESLNQLMSLGASHWSALRSRVSSLLRVGATEREEVKRALVPMNAVDMLLPASIGDYTDFYASVFHATNVGSMFRPDNPLLPNYKHVPIGYHGRASSIVVSGTPVYRPQGQTKDDQSERPVFGPCAQLDYELEVGAFVGPANTLGNAVVISRAADHLFGLCLLNDWSARDIQKWEYQPLGPFLAKNFATTVSPWVVTMEALAPFRVPAFQRPKGDPSPLPYLAHADDARSGGVDVTLEVFIRSEQMREKGTVPVRLSRGSFKEMYWTFAQLLAHHTSNGCNLQPGDLLGSGTVSGREKDSRGCLLELTWRGAEPLRLPTGETRRFLEDGDEVTLRGYCERDGYRRIGLGECRGVILPARQESER
jgi:fumarylacetoacetase